MFRQNIFPIVGIALVLACTVFAILSTQPRPQSEPFFVLGEPVPAVIEHITEPEQLRYIAIEAGCDAVFGGSCVRARSGPGTGYPIVLRLRSGMVLRAGTPIERNGHLWYPIKYEEWLRYPDRARSLYVAGDFVRPFLHIGPEEVVAATTSKRIIIDRGEQMLYAYEGSELFMRAAVSTGIRSTPTPRGTFTIFRKTPTRYMQGPLPGISAKEYDLPGVPWDMYFTAEGAAIHGAYWHDDFGKPHSNGCVNLSYQDAKTLYEWAPVGATVIVRD